MAIISYAQNFEDVMLWRALKHLDTGFYIDVGAAWPNEHSVTKLFYENGWNGVNVEPNPALNQELREERQMDTNLCVAVGEKEDNLTMSFLDKTGLSTLDDSIADKHRSQGRNLYTEQVRVTTLSNIWQEHVPSSQPVHFLKVDVEGFEEAVLRGNNWDLNRPWIVLVEATLPMSQIESYASWEPILLDANYKFAYADGLNRFYIADEHPELLPAFVYPPNVFDEFLLIGQRESEDRAHQAEIKLHQAEIKAHQAMSQLETLYTSASWRLTKPLRVASNALRKLFK